MTKMNDKPNIFNYATKELSQDAVICWLIAWAGRKDVQDAEDEALHECGRQFVEVLLDKHRASLAPDIEEIEIRRQDNDIDVLACVNRYQVLLIEDKIDTDVRNGQLEGYYKAVVEGKTGLGKVREKNLYPIFFKTGNQSLAQDDVIEKKRVETGKECKYKVFKRTEFLEKVLNDYKGSNPILTDFRARLQEWEDDTNSFKDWKTGESKKWSWNAWQGFFRHLEEKLTNCWGWGYVPKGDFLGLWWNARPIKEGSVYLQLEIVTGKPDVQKLCFKVAVNKEKLGSRPRGAVRNEWHNLVCDVANKDVPKEEDKKAKKPDRFGNGETMTIALWKEPWLAFGDSGTLDLNETVANLKKAEAVLAKAIDMEKRQGAETQS